MDARDDLVARAHLKDATGFSPPVHRGEPSANLRGLIRRHWTPVWDLPPGEETVQRILRYPVCLVTIAPADARFHGPERGLSTKTLSGSGWTAGLMLQPAAGYLLSGASVQALCERSLPLTELRRFEETIPAVRELMAPDPADPERIARTRRLLEEAIADLEVDEEGILVNAMVERIENDSAITRVAQVCTEFAVAERTLQRMFARRVGLSPRWVISRRRLWDAVASLRSGERGNLARIAADLGYTDQAHFTRDFRAVLGMTPGRFLAENVSGASAPSSAHRAEPGSESPR
ncbi:helix-turn-helix domain-containing protein [Ruania halotolerans]|uniref:helix-turn-helix domain-containing protein n=1 Tax=Ruania halotolerans TaxID=2897773 RepID=UPI001E2AC6F8|nr:AraC family transcriptional regulator [Ruania halotolerans]UFU06333.1 helix-turn-helix domain-containing protein [Ruania halotolerans]